MKRFTLLLSIVVIFSLLVPACASPTPEIIEKEVVVVVTATKEAPVKIPKPPTPTPPPPALLEVVEGRFPLWDREDFEMTMRLLPIAPVSKTFMKDPKTRPPYYKGQKPLSYTTYRNPLEAREPLAPKELAHIFEKFDNYFLHTGWFYGMSEGAITIDKTGEHLLAEAQLLEIPKDSAVTVVEIFEVHYNLDGKPVFSCISQFNRYGFKVSERDQRGKKEADYYFIWPMGYLLGY